MHLLRAARPPSASPNRAASLSGMRRAFGLEIAAIGLLVIACTAGPSESSSPPATASSSASQAPTAAVLPTAAPTASSSPAPTASASLAAEPPPNVRTTPLGQVSGNWLFYGVQIPRPERNRVEVQIVAVPASGGAAKIVVAFDAAIPTQGVGYSGIFDNAPYLRRQFSPDGRRMVFSIDGQLVVIDLVTGQAKRLFLDLFEHRWNLVQGLYPSWSKDGSQIAFIFAEAINFAGRIGVVPAAGGSPRELAGEISAGNSLEWSPDGSRILFIRPGGDAAFMAIMDVASGQVHGLPELAGSSSPWRARSPELAIAIQYCTEGQVGPGKQAKIVTIDVGTDSVRTLVDVADPCAVGLGGLRWNPAVPDELLYIAAGVNNFETHVLNIATGKDTRLPISAYEATWTWDGSAVAYLAKSPGSSLGSAVRVWKRDGSGETELRRATDGEAFFSIASVNY